MIKNITIGTFEVNSGRIVASDPCYSIDVWCHKNICNRIYDNWNCDMDNSGVWSSSGYGDGGYEVFVAWEEDEVIGLKVIFIEEE